VNLTAKNENVMNSIHKDHILHLEHGEWVAYKSKGYRDLGKGLESARPEDGKSPTDIDRIPLGTPDYQEACVRLDRRLKKEKKPKYDPNHPAQTRLA
jgi:hypothetical protein